MGIAFGCSIEAATLAAPIAKARNALTLLWFAHPSDSWRLALAERLADRILTSIPGSYPRRSRKVRVIGQAIDTDRFALAPPPGRRDAELRLVAIGRMSKAKRYDLALEVVTSLSYTRWRTHNPEDTLRFFGLRLYEAGMISYEDALRNADSLNDLRLEIKLHGKDAKNRNVMAGIGNMDLVPDSSNPMAANRF
jgi:glycosyltransferase involved in cell wall biosynthesis